MPATVMTKIGIPDSAESLSLTRGPNRSSPSVEILYISRRWFPKLFLQTDVRSGHRTWQSVACRSGADARRSLQGEKDQTSLSRNRKTNPRQTAIGRVTTLVAHEMRGSIALALMCVRILEREGSARLAVNRRQQR
jgi:hypothetical protein